MILLMLQGAFGAVFRAQKKSDGEVLFNFCRATSLLK